MKVLLVGGPPRSGTRFITNALNEHPDVFVSGEIPERHLLPAALEACAALRRAHEAEGRAPEEWAAIGPSLLVQIAATLRKEGPVRQRPKRHFQGFKSPRVEMAWREIAAIVGPFSFIYCLRPFAEHFLSCANRWPSARIGTLADRYLHSIHEAEAMMGAEDVTLAAFSLPGLAREGTSHLAAIGRRLGMREPAAWARRIDVERKANSAEKFVAEKRVELSPEEAGYIAGRPDLRAAYDGFWEAYERSAP